MLDRKTIDSTKLREIKYLINEKMNGSDNLSARKILELAFNTPVDVEGREEDLNNALLECRNFMHLHNMQEYLSSNNKLFIRESLSNLTPNQVSYINQLVIKIDQRRKQNVIVLDYEEIMTLSEISDTLSEFFKVTNINIINIKDEVKLIVTIDWNVEDKISKLKW